MGVSKRFVVTKDEITNAISYLEYEKLSGFDVKPKGNITIDDMINVEKMVIINPSLIEKLIDKKCKKTLEKILNMTAYIYNEVDDSDSDEGLNLILNEIAKFKSLLEKKYCEYMKEKKYKLLLKKLEIIENEVKLRKLARDLIIDDNKSLEKEEKRKGR